MIRGAFIGVLALLALGGSASAGDEPVREDPVRARVFEVHYRPLADAADLVMDLLSADGQVTTRPRLNVLVVQDRDSVLDRVESLLRSFDLAPKSVQLTLALFLGTKGAGDEQETDSESRRGVIDLPQLHFTHWRAYDSLGSRAVQGSEGDEMTAHLSDDYRVIFTVQRVDERQGVVKLDGLSLQRVEQDDEGNTRIESLYSMGIVVDIGKQQIVGAAAGPDADRALFLTLLAEAR